jgi:hypothetical protein
MFDNQNAEHVNAWTYVAANSQATDDGTWKNFNGRLTWQASARHWNGVEVNVSARIRRGLTLQGGTSTGRTTTDNCDIKAKLPEIGVTATNTCNPYCHVEPPFKTLVKGLASYRMAPG